MNNNRALLLHIIASFVCITNQVVANQASAIKERDVSLACDRNKEYHIADDLKKRLFYKEHEVSIKYNQLALGKPTWIDSYLCEQPSIGCMINEDGYVLGIRTTGFACDEWDHVITMQNANKNSYAHLAKIYYITASRIDIFNEYLYGNKSMHSQSPICAHIVSLLQNRNNSQWWNHSLYVASHFDSLRWRHNRLKNEIINRKNSEALKEFMQVALECDRTRRIISNQK